MTPEPTNQFISLSRRRALDHAAQLIHAAWRSFDEARPEQPDVAEQVQKLLSLPLPEHGVDAVDALDDADLILDQSLSQSRPRFFAFVGSSGLEMGVLADALAASHDVNLAVYAGAANLVERQALHWIADLVGFSGKFGTFTSGGMLSNLTALTAAREHALPDSRTHGIRQSVAIYTSRDAHSSIARAVEILGFGTNALRDIPIDTNRRMISAELEKAISADVANNVTPIAIVASAGTTLAGAVDPLDEIADIAEKHNIWLHIDGAYGAPAAAVRAKSKLFVGLARADS
ncbi:MAG: pyridoxal phosphate-dependent decarboxylase family protein, partial [Candidatus Promineifilaceae bacterium]